MKTVCLLLEAARMLTPSHLPASLIGIGGREPGSAKAKVLWYILANGRRILEPILGHN